jgi:hypothetical protein
MLARRIPWESPHDHWLIAWQPFLQAHSRHCTVGILDRSHFSSYTVTQGVFCRRHCCTRCLKHSSEVGLIRQFVIWEDAGRASSRRESGKGGEESLLHPHTTCDSLPLDQTARCLYKISETSEIACYLEGKLVFNVHSKLNTVVKIFRLFGKVDA